MSPGMVADEDDVLNILEQILLAVVEPGAARAFPEPIPVPTNPLPATANALDEPQPDLAVVPFVS